MKNTLWILLFLLSSLSAFSQAKDFDGNNYQTVKIGDQVWMSENLNVKHYRNGDKIVLCKNKDEWAIANIKKLPACAYFNYDEKNEKEHGLLYNQWAVMDERGLAPEGYIIPSREDYEILINFLGGELKAGHALKSTNGWKEAWP